MATKSWTGGAGDGDWSNSSNWSGGVPANSDTIVINASSDDIDTSLPGAPLTGVILRIGPGFTGTIGGTSNYLDLDGSLLEFASGGRSHYLAGTWTTWVVSGGQPSETMLFAKPSADTDIGTLRVTGNSSGGPLGTVTIGANAVLDDVILSGSPGVTVSIASSVSSLDNITVESGTVSCAAAVGTKIRVLGGTVQLTGSATATAVEIDGAGTFDHRSSGTITTLDVIGGTFNGSNNPAATVTVTTATMYEGSTVDLRSGLDNYTFTNPITVHGGKLYPPIGSTLTIT